jgi:hypothetical protein
MISPGTNNGAEFVAAVVEVTCRVVFPLDAPDTTASLLNAPSITNKEIPVRREN